MNNSALDLVQISFVEAAIPPTWIALSLSLATFCLSLYLLSVKVGINRTRMKNDRHYALRLFLCILLVLNRVADMIGLFLSTKMATWPRQTLLTWQHYRSQMLIFAFFLLFTITQYCIMFLIYLLTVDRYVRVAMVLQNSRVAKVFLWIQRCLAIMMFTIIILYLVDYLPHFIIGASLSNQYPNWKILSFTRKVIEIVSVTSGSLLDFGLNLGLILFSTRSRRQAVAGKSRPILPGRTLPAPNYHHIAIKMIMNFAILTIVDIVYITILFSVSLWSISVINSVQYDNMMSILGSWLPLRVYLVFVLLDLFLQDLKPKRQERKRKERIWLNNARARIKNTWERVQKKLNPDEESIISSYSTMQTGQITGDSLLSSNIPTQSKDPFRAQVAGTNV